MTTTILCVLLALALAVVWSLHREKAALEWLLADAERRNAALRRATPAELRKEREALEQHKRSLERFEALRRAEMERVSLN